MFILISIKPNEEQPMYLYIGIKSDRSLTQAASGGCDKLIQKPQYQHSIWKKIVQTIKKNSPSYLSNCFSVSVAHLFEQGSPILQNCTHNFIKPCRLKQERY